MTGYGGTGNLPVVTKVNTTSVRRLCISACPHDSHLGSQLCNVPENYQTPACAEGEDSLLGLGVAVAGRAVRIITHQVREEGRHLKRHFFPRILQRDRRRFHQLDSIAPGI
jgi:hypothetical protein